MTIRIGYQIEKLASATCQWCSNGCKAGDPVPLETLIELQDQVQQVHCDNELLNYLQDIVDATRRAQTCHWGSAPVVH